MLRKIIKPTSENYNLHIPREYINQEIEILVLPFVYTTKDENDKNIKNDFKQLSKKTAGLLSERKIDPLKWFDTSYAKH